MLIEALSEDNLDVRVTEGLPRIALHFRDLDWERLIAEARRRGIQNRLGFIVTLARQVAAMRSAADVERLRTNESELERWKVETEDTLCHATTSPAERRWLSDERPPEARRWRMLADLEPEYLDHVR